MTVTDRFLRYVTIDTQSNPKTGAHPSTQKQFDLAKLLVEELHSLGVDNAFYDENAYVYAYLPATAENMQSLGFIAHLDTEPVCSGANVKPRVVTYQGGDIILENGAVISPTEFPYLENYKNQELIVTDGTTLLGADDKAGVAEIMTAVEYLINHPEIPHGKIGIAFTPDEEIGEGASLFDVAGFGCDYAYTIDGEEIGELGYETFNAAEAVVTLKGKNIHPGVAKNKMVNCAVIAGEFLATLPENETPATTENREGFYHVCDVKANVESGEISLIIRDHDKNNFEARKAFIQNVCAWLADRHGKDAVSVVVRDQYYNCYEKIKEHFHLIENARNAYKQAGVTPIESPVRGGTDGSTLSFMGLPCPNIFTGGHNAHSVREFIPIPSMEKAVQVIIRLAMMTATENA